MKIKLSSETGKPKYIHDEYAPKENINSINGVKNATFIDNIWEIESENADDIRPAIFEFAVKNQLILLTLQEKQQNLENVFHQLTQNDA